MLQPPDHVLQSEKVGCTRLIGGYGATLGLVASDATAMQVLPYETDIEVMHATVDAVVSSPPPPTRTRVLVGGKCGGEELGPTAGAPAAGSEA